MTPDQKATFDCLESVIAEPPERGRHAAIKRAFREHKEEMMKPIKKPWYKRIFK